ncbi:Leukotriene A-4 hydrolase/aminopeptidase [Paramicrosporidium saccamoebae]|uniref:Leukotriene A-4 hydrolase/aminopeptidase n=1 Tax=Paramicrosporidium saccamoebae TaxID=1246581 RepID=A0A2H9TFW1_9FUNG|nr:Leukotriene A-4 hydrolase/aminopeptidase [Paramicrosporidium saccamoebae]
MRLHSLVTGSASLLRDPNSVANIDVFQTTHIHLAWDVDFDTSTIDGTATLTLKRVGDGNQLVLDCSHLVIHNIIETNDLSSAPLNHDFKPSASLFGGSLTITLPEGRDTYTISINYATTDKSSALQWLTPEQTLGKVYPYLFSQCQAIHARTMLPCQDTPAIKATYSASVRVPSPLNAVMSANRRKESEASSSEGRYFEFKQTTPIPAYLIAIAVGDIHSKEIGPRSVVWSETKNLEAAAEEFSETEAFIETAESLVGPYVWERYDILVLPPSFPYGGMENPCLTFITPSLIAGDKSLVNVLAHEISHSWTGNLVSCASWEHFWLNEGFTRFLERKILAKARSEAERQLRSTTGLSALKEDLEFLKNGPLTQLVPDLSADSPDDAFSQVPYEKGYMLLYTLEQLVGAKKFETCFRAHIEKFAGRSIDTDQFKTFIMYHFVDDHPVHQQLVKFPWDEWFYGTGLGPSTPTFSEELVTPCKQLAESWIETDITNEMEFGDIGAMHNNPSSMNGAASENAPNDYGKWHSRLWKETGVINEIEFSSLGAWQKVLFFGNLLESEHVLSVKMINKIADDYSLHTCTNVEVLLKWYQLCIKSRAIRFYEMAAHYAVAHGRMRYNRPIYRALYNSGPIGQDLALETFKLHRAVYHPIAVQMISKDLNLEL